MDLKQAIVRMVTGFQISEETVERKTGRLGRDGGNEGRELH